MKEWSCCKKRSHDFNQFLELPGCQIGPHSSEKPILNKAPPAAAPVRVSSASSISATSKDDCARCKQGFYCSDHGKQTMEPSTKQEVSTEKPSDFVKKTIDINEPQMCKNHACGKTFKEKENHETACNYHPGPAVFHDRSRGWKCCDVHVKEYDEFLTIPPCTKGWHNADP